MWTPGPPDTLRPPEVGSSSIPGPFFAVSRGCLEGRVTRMSLVLFFLLEAEFNNGIEAMLSFLSQSREKSQWFE